MPGRDNGLRASRYAPLLDLEPQLADAMLEALRDEGLAAYAAAAPGVSGPYLDVHMPDQPKDRLWVDADAAERARAVVDARLPELRQEYAGMPAAEPTAGPAAGPEPDEDAVWRAIVAGYEATGADPVPWWPTMEPISPAEPGPPVSPVSPVPPDEPDGEAGPPTAGSRAHGPAPPEDHFVPPPPPPLPTTDTITKLAWAGVVGGPAYLLLGTVTGRGLSERAAILALVAFVVGFVTLIARMKDRPPTDSGPDDGAVV